MSALLLGATAAAGIGLSAYGKYKEDEAARRRLALQRKYLKEREQLLAKQKDVAVDQSALQMEGAAMQATEASRNAATEAFLAESAATAGAAMSGTTGGSAQFQVGDIGMEGQRTLLNVNRGNELTMEGLELQNEQQMLGFEGQALSMKYERKGLDLQAEELEYAKSPVSWGMTLATGGLSGLQFGASLQSAYDQASQATMAGKQKPFSNIPAQQAARDSYMNEMANPYRLLDQQAARDSYMNGLGSSWQNKNPLSLLLSGAY